MINTIIIFLLIFIITYLFYIFNKRIEHFGNPYLFESHVSSSSNENIKYYNINQNQKPKIWMYWETLPGKTKPGYIDLCYESVLYNCGKCFDVILLNEKTIYNYLPEIRTINLSKLEIAQRVDYYRYSLLDKYGGIWLDADILVVKCFCPLYKNLEEHDYVGFGCGFDKGYCSEKLDGYGRPLNWIMISNPKTEYIKCIKEKAENKILSGENIEYHGIGKDILKDCHDKMKEDINWTYKHIPSKCNDYDTKGNKLNNIFNPMEYKDCEKDRYFFPLYNTAPGYPDWFKNLTVDELKTTKLPIEPFISAAFSNKQSCNK